jgi:hypothetical protein
MAKITGEKVDGGRVRQLSDQGGNPSQYVFCPACKTIHLFDDRWTFNNNFDKPTFNPSMLVHEHRNENYWQPRCHSFVRDGKIEFLGDCTHDMKGQTIELPIITDDMW